MYVSLLKYWMDLVRLQRMPPEKARAEQVRRLRRLFEFARERSPFYHDLYTKAGVMDLTLRTMDDVRRLPVVDKRMMIECGLDRVLTVDRNSPTLACDMTSGSTGEQFPVYVTPQVNFTSHLRVYSALSRMGYRPYHRLMMIWRYDATKQLDIEKRTLLGSVQKHLGLFRREIVSIFEAPETLIEAVRHSRPHLVFATRAVLELMARHLQVRGAVLPIPFVVSGAETMLPEHRRLFEEVFQARVMNLYGCAEAPTMAFALDDNHFEVFSNLVYYEYENVGYEGDQRSGDIVITNLLNYAMPIIRYCLRDRGRIISDDDTGAARFIGPLLGREDDVITLANGYRFVFHHSYQMFASFTECRQYRFVQLPDGSMRLWLVPSNDTEEGREAARRKALQIWRDKFPDVALEIEFKNSLPLGRTGKHRVIERLEDWPST